MKYCIFTVLFPLILHRVDGNEIDNVTSPNEMYASFIM
jgi:hypothetical protein